MLTQKDQKTIRSKLDKIYKIFLSKKDIDYFENEINPLPKNLNKFNKLFNKKNISRKNCVLMPLIALKKLSIDE